MTTIPDHQEDVWLQILELVFTQAADGTPAEDILEMTDELFEALKVYPGGAEAHNGRGEILWSGATRNVGLKKLNATLVLSKRYRSFEPKQTESLLESKRRSDGNYDGNDRLEV